MLSGEIGLFRLAGQRLEWADKRQELLATNIANANTPGFQPRDVSPFAGAVSAIALTQTSPGHIGTGASPPVQASSRPTGKAPGGNGVAIEDELGKVADTAGVQQLVLGLEHSYLGMFKTAIGRAG